MTDWIIVKLLFNIQVLYGLPAPCTGLGPKFNIISKRPSDRGRYKRFSGAPSSTLMHTTHCGAVDKRGQNDHKMNEKVEPSHRAYNSCNSIIDNTCQPNISSRIQKEQKIQTHGNRSLHPYHKRWKGSLHQTTSDMEHR